MHFSNYIRQIDNLFIRRQYARELRGADIDAARRDMGPGQKTLEKEKNKGRKEEKKKKKKKDKIR